MIRVLRSSLIATAVNAPSFCSVQAPAATSTSPFAPTFRTTTLPSSVAIRSPASATSTTKRVPRTPATAVFVLTSNIEAGFVKTRETRLNTFPRATVSTDLRVLDAGSTMSRRSELVSAATVTRLSSRKRIHLPADLVVTSP